MIYLKDVFVFVLEMDENSAMMGENWDASIGTQSHQIINGITISSPISTEPEPYWDNEITTAVERNINLPPPPDSLATINGQNIINFFDPIVPEEGISYISDGVAPRMRNYLKYTCGKNDII